jgi:hypothetical protein
MVEINELLNFKELANLIISRVQLVQTSANVKIVKVLEAILLYVQLGETHHLTGEGELSDVLDFILVQNELSQISKSF